MDCFSPCSPRTCPNAIHSYHGNPPLCPMMCETGVCDCQEGFLRNKCGVCVPEVYCSMSCECKDEEKEEKRCVENCATRTCEHILSNKPREMCQSNFCTDRCECKPGFARDRFDECVEIDHCYEKM